MSTAFVFLRLLFAGSRLQKWLAVPGLLSIAAGLLVPVPAAKIGFGIYGLISLLAQPALFGGVLLRELSAPRTLRLIPNSRARLLAALVLTAVVLASLVTLVIWTLGMDPPPTTPLSVVFTLAVALATTVLIGQFAFSTSVGTLTLWFLMIGTTPFILRKLDQYGLLSTEVFTPGRMGSYSAFAWLVFGAWFLRVRSIRRAAPTGLAGDASVRVPTRPPENTPLLLRSLPAIFVTSALGGIGAFPAGGRARLLWLRTDYDRNELFRVCEQRAWIHFVAFCTPVLILLALLAWLPTSRDAVPWFAVSQLATGINVLYLALMHVRGWKLADILSAVVLAACWLSTPLLMQAERLPLVAAVLVSGQAALAIGLRTVARRRWRELDWLVCRPPRLSGVPAGSR